MSQKRARRYNIDIDPSNDKELCEFFDKHYDYTIPELSCRYKIPVSTLRYWRRRINKNYHTENAKKLLAIAPTRKAKEYKVLPKETWDNAAWFKKMYQNEKLGTHIIAKMTGISFVSVKKRLKRYKIPIRSLEESFLSKNSFFNEEWLWDNYFRKGRTLTELAKDANVSPYTISNWLIYFNLLPRSNSAAQVLVGTQKRVARYRGTSLSKVNKRTGKSSSSKKS